MLAEAVFAIGASGGGTGRCRGGLLGSVYALPVAVAVIVCIARTALLR
jgi:hypothetical protein